MLVELVRTETTTNIYLEQLKHFADKACHPELEQNKATFQLSLTDMFQCGVNRIHNQLTGQSIYYHHVVVEDSSLPKEVILVKCVTSQRREKRNVLPAGFQESDFRESELQVVKGSAPEPILGVGVRQGGQLVTGELNVNPGTPLQMEIFLDKTSAPVYGLLVSYMQVTDTKTQEETIIFNGCSVDPYLFENFNTVDGDFLSAKFRAFKFPESTYVQFKGTVNVCLDKCRGVECSNGQTGYGRRRREVSSIPADPNKVFEVTMSTFIRVDYKDDNLLEKGKLGGSVIQSHSDQVNINATISQEQPDAREQHLQLETEEIHEELRYTVIENEGNMAAVRATSFLAIVAMLCLLLIH
ncbi:hypothetical protein L798_06275 [Zootermopsis nevadensis]|uniref:ZP domain-containing protein n=2 Tax=Zootermopsis nevadensis TaxID=136037 RepID=A0A067R735_ZOONE|nr:hypothetical protein L798_06275 [Zootermopsis nevadensis]